jgi:hypothetical protein
MSLKLKSFPLLGLMIFSAAFFSACNSSQTVTEGNSNFSQSFDVDELILLETEILDDDFMVTDGIKHSVPLNQILAGGPPKDGIPSIDDPKFISVEEASEFLLDDGIGISVTIGETTRFYPFQILVWHEIVNDTIEGQDVLITYCPLCGSGIAFDPIVQGQSTEFGTSGKLWNSNLVMYDRLTESYWSQILGQAIVGSQTGETIQLLPHQNMQWKTWKEQFPEAEVLSDDTGYVRNYSNTPYGDYSQNDSIYFPVDNESSEFHPKAPLYGIQIDGITKAYTIEELEKTNGSFTDQIGETLYTVSYESSTQSFSMTEQESGKTLIPFYSFWFSWVAVHPDTEIFKNS